MMIKARDLKVGQLIKVGPKWETVFEIDEFETGVMVFLGNVVRSLNLGNARSWANATARPKTTPRTFLDIYRLT